nr:MlrC C-terminal domain-containing protein [Kineosporia babensis]
MNECLDAALASPARPFFISDSGDNPTAGGAGDVTWTLEKVLERTDLAGRTVIYASIPDLEAADAAAAAGVGAHVRLEAGARVDDRHAGPVTLEGVVTAVRHGDRDAEIEVVVKCGAVSVILTRRRKPYHHEHDFTDLGLDPRSADIVFVKIGYLEPELFDMASDWLLALTPGGVDQDLLRLGHQRIERPMYPYDADAPTPDLHPRLIPASNQPLSEVQQ